MSSRFKLGWSSCGWLIAGLGAGCSSQADPEYAGEALATLRGAVVAEGAASLAPPGGAKAAVLWQQRQLAMVTSSVTVEGVFPSQFSMNLYQPPPDGALLNVRSLAPPEQLDPAPLPVMLDRGPLAVGWIVAIAADADENNVHPSDVLGYSLDTMVVYVDGTTAPDELATYAALWQFPATPGYHLARLERSDRELYDRCTWNGLCMDRQTDPCLRDGSCVPAGSTLSRFTEFEHAAMHESYELCVQALPDADRCTVTSPIPGEAFDPSSNLRCEELTAEHPRRRDCQPPLVHVENPAGFEHTVTITMGSTFYDVYL